MSISIEQSGVRSEFPSNELKFYATQFYLELIGAFEFQNVIYHPEETLEETEEYWEKKLSANNCLHGLYLDRDLVVLAKLQAVDGDRLRVYKRPIRGLVPGDLRNDIKEEEKNPFYWHQYCEIVIPDDPSINRSFAHSEIISTKEGLIKISSINNQVALKGIERFLVFLSMVPQPFRDVFRGIPNLY